MQTEQTKPTLLADYRRLQAENEALRAQVLALAQQVAELERKLAQALKNSSNSSKPPSSDIVKPPKDPKHKKKKRKIGGQPGHPLHLRPAFGPEEIDETKPYTLASCPVCGGALTERPSGEAQVVQQVELVAKPVWMIEHRGLSYWCAHCQCIHTAPLPPEEVRGGLLGPRLTAQVAYLKGACHTSFSTIQRYLDEVLGLRVSRGYFEQALASVRLRFFACATVGVPDTREAQNLAARLKKDGDAYFRFVTTPGLEPTNNLAEQLLRFMVLDRKVTQGTRSLQGRLWCARIWTTMATCTLQRKFLIPSYASGRHKSKAFRRLCVFCGGCGVWFWWLPCP